MSPSKKIAYSAVAVALASIAAVATIFLPLTVVPLILSAFCFYIAFSKCGIVHGIITMVATGLITFFAGGVSLTLILLCVLFMPYTIVTLFIKKFTYFKLVGAIVRILVVAALFNAALVGVYFIAKSVLLADSGIDLLGLVGNYGYALVALIGSIAAIFSDFLFTQVVVVVGKHIK